MAFFTYVSNKKWATYTILSIFTLAFVAAQVSGIIEYFFNANKAPATEVGIIDNQKIHINTYQERFFVIKNTLIQQNIRKDRIAVVAHDQTWNHFLNQHLYTKLYHLIGIQVLDQEVMNILEEARHIPHIKQLDEFLDGSGKFDKAKWRTTLSNFAQSPQGKKQIQFLANDIKVVRAKQKLDYCIQATVHTTKLEAAQYPNDTLKINYLYIPYTDSLYQGQVTNQEKVNYLKDHAHNYQVKSARVLSYIVLPVNPSKQDQKLFQEEADQLKEQFAKSTKPEQFAKQHSLNPDIYKAWKKKEPISEIFKKSKQGEVSFEQQGYTLKMYRKTGPRKAIKIEIQCQPSEYTHEEVSKKAETFRKAKNLATWIKKATQDDLEIKSITLQEKDLIYTLGEKHIFRRIQRWAFHPKTQVNNISEPIEHKNAYYVCIMKKINQPGTNTLKNIGYNIEAKLREKKTIKQITEKLKHYTKKEKSLKQIALAYGKNAKVYSLDNLTIDHNQLPHVGKATQVIGTAFALQIGERSDIIADETGIFIIERLPKANSITPISQIQKKIDSQEKKTILNDLYKLCKKNKVKDQRHLFY